MGYVILNYCPRSDVSAARHNFAIGLPRDWQQKVEKLELTQDRVDAFIKAQGRAWLDACGYTRIFDPDNCGFEADPTLPPGPRAYHSYKPWHIRVSWGPWGTESIYIPGGDACGLNLDRTPLGNPLGGPMLLSHNIDTWSQKNLLLLVFCRFAELIIP